MSRENILYRVRTALGRSEGAPLPPPPPVRLRIPEVSLEARIASMTARLEALAGRVLLAENPREAGELVARAVAGHTAIASNAPFLRECGITGLAGVRSDITNREELQELCASADVGITSADYALADTGTLVMLSSPFEA